jgi:hypothetical protein
MHVSKGSTQCVVGHRSAADLNLVRHGDHSPASANSCAAGSTTRSWSERWRRGASRERWRSRR